MTLTFTLFETYRYSCNDLLSSEAQAEEVGGQQLVML